MHATTTAVTATELFVQHYGRPPGARAHAPGRLEFIGNHVDYNGGLVLGAAIDRGVQAAAGLRTDRKVRVRSAHYDGVVETSLDGLQPLAGREAWANYPLGVAWAWAKNGGAMATGFDLALTSDLPAGAGLSSSAAVELATAVALGGVYGNIPEPGVLARWCRQAENDFVGMPCGILDQGCSAFGQAGRLVLIDCRTEAFSTVPLPETVRFWVFNTGKKHALLDSLYATRRGECEAALKILQQFYPQAQYLAEVSAAQVEAQAAHLPAMLLARARHVTREIERVRATAQALEKGDLGAVGRQLAASHQSSRELFENSIAELDFLVDGLGGLPGVWGARLTGGGFGGAVMAMTTPEFTAATAEPVVAAYAAKFGHAPTIFTTRTGDGAQALPV
jgi:galactokinase